MALLRTRRGGDSATEQLLKESRPHRARRLSRRELGVEVAAASALLAVAVALPVLAHSDRSVEPLVALALVASHGVAARIRLFLGAGYAMPTQLVLVPMLFLLPAPMVPAAVAAGLVIAALADVLAGRAHPERLITAFGDAWHAVAAVLVVLAAGEPEATLDAAPVLLMALGAQCALDLLSAALRERLGRGIPASLQVRVIGLVYLIDVLLTPIGMLAAVVSVHQPFAFLVVLPLLALLGAFAADRRGRIEEAVQRVDALSRERERLHRALRRIGAALASALDRGALIDLTLQTTAEALEAECAYVEASDGPATLGGAPCEALRPLMSETAEAARRTGDVARCARAGSFALAHPLRREAGLSDPPAVLVVSRRGRSFNDDERELFCSLVSQAVVALDNLELHDRLRAQATTDDLTGLSNHRRFQEVLAREVERARRRGAPLALVMLDIDDFKAVNDRHGHQQGDRVLREVAALLRGACRAGDEPARYGGEELAVVLSGTDLAGASALAERIRAALHAHRIPLEGAGHLAVTASLGAAALSADSGDAASLIARADAALYDAKRSGKDRVVLAGATSPAASCDRLLPSARDAAAAP